MIENRRTFMGALTAASFQRVAGANERLQVACIGCGIIAGHHLSHLDSARDVEVVAMCDAYLPRAEKYVQQFNPRAKAYQDFRRVLEDKSIQAVFICTPPHWHALMTMMACAAGKDVYVEKPMTVFVREGRWAIEAARRYKRVVQVGTQQRSLPHYRKAAVELLRGGFLGKISSVRSGAVRNISPGWGRPADSAPPPGLDWDLFLGPAARHPHNSNRGMNNFKLQTGRWFWDTDGGQQTNMGVHEMDVILWALGVKGPKAVVSFGGRRVLDDFAEVPDTQDSLFDFGQTTAVFSYREASVGGQPIPVLWFFGTKGGMNLSRAGFEIFPDAKNPEGDLPGSVRGGKREPAVEALKMKPESDVYGGMDLHERNFIECVKSRKDPNATVEDGHYSAAACHLANLSLRLGGRSLRWDAEREDFVGDPEASRMLVREYSAPWDRELRALGLG